MKKTTVIALAAIVLAVTNIVLAVAVYQLYYPMTGVVPESAKVTVYSDSSLNSTYELPDSTMIDWGNLDYGSNTKFLWIKNTGNCPVSLNLTINNLPIGWSLSWDCENYNLGIGQTIKATLSLIVASNATSGSYTWDSWIKATTL